MVHFDFVNQVRSERVKFLKCNNKSENINSNYVQMIFALATNVSMWTNYIIAQQYFKKLEIMLCLRDMTNIAEIFKVV